MERFHSVFATFAHKTDFAKVELEVGVDKDKNIIKLFTVAVDHMNKAFHTDSQLKMEVRYYGVNIFDWRMVIFNTVAGGCGFNLLQPRLLYTVKHHI